MVINSLDKWVQDVAQDWGKRASEAARSLYLEQAAAWSVVKPAGEFLASITSSVTQVVGKPFQWYASAFTPLREENPKKSTPSTLVKCVTFLLPIQYCHNRMLRTANIFQGFLNTLPQPPSIYSEAIIKCFYHHFPSANKNTQIQNFINNNWKAAAEKKFSEASALLKSHSDSSLMQAFVNNAVSSLTLGAARFGIISLIGKTITPFVASKTLAYLRLEGLMDIAAYIETGVEAVISKIPMISPAMSVLSPKTLLMGLLYFKCLTPPEVSIETEGPTSLLNSVNIDPILTLLPQVPRETFDKRNAHESFCETLQKAMTNPTGFLTEFGSQPSPGNSSAHKEVAEQEVKKPQSVPPPPKRKEPPNIKEAAPLTFSRLKAKGERTHSSTKKLIKWSKDDDGREYYDYPLSNEDKIRIYKSTPDFVPFKTESKYFKYENEAYSGDVIECDEKGNLAWKELEKNLWSYMRQLGGKTVKIFRTIDKDGNFFHQRKSRNEQNSNFIACDEDGYRLNSDSRRRS